VWLELSRVFDPDIVVGASVGSLNGWMAACRSDPRELAEQWMNLGPLASIRWQRPRSIADGVLDSSALEEWIQTACSCHTPSRRLGVVLTRLRTLRPALFETPDIDWRHIASSCAVPVFLRHHRIDGEFYSDGGIVDPLPLWAAQQMGATTIVTVNAMKHRPLAMRGVVGALQTCTGYRPADCSGVRIVDISPEGRLGSARDSMYWDPERARRWIEQGKRDALRAEPQVIECQSWPSTAFTD
jgi:predicted acylesterase/phospholipase RssA